MDTGQALDLSQANLPPGKRLLVQMAQSKPEIPISFGCLVIQEWSPSGLRLLVSDMRGNYSWHRAEDLQKLPIVEILEAIDE